MKHHIPGLTFLALSLLGGGCSLAPPQYLIADNTAATVLEIQRPITTEPGWARAFLQAGELVHYGAFDRYRPQCHLMLSTLADTAQTIQPGRFAITRVSYRQEEVVHAPGIQVASLSLSLGSDMGFQTQQVVFKLSAETQSQVSQLICGGAFDTPGRAAAPTPAEISQALGDYALLR